MDVTLRQLVGSVDDAASSPLARIAEASATARHLGELGDLLVDHFVAAGRASGYSWADIGDRLGVTRQAVQRRFATPRPEARPNHQPEGSIPRRGRREHRGKYRALWEWLNEQPGDRVETSFVDIERLMGMPLPPSSRRHQPHWHSYEGSAVVRAVIDAGWKATRVDLEHERLTFVRSH
jgi:hypothetical protein